MTSAPERLTLLLDGYLSAADADGVLVKDKLPLRALAKLMPDITLFEMTAADEVLYRLAGQNILDRMGFPLQGVNMLDFVQEDDKARTIKAHKDILQYRCGYLMIFQADAPAHKIRRIEAVRLPVRMQRGGPVNGFLGCNLHHSLFGISDASLPEKPFKTIRGELTRYFDIGNGVPPDSEMVSPLLPHASRMIDAQPSAHGCLPPYSPGSFSGHS